MVISMRFLGGSASVMLVGSRQVPLVRLSMDAERMRGLDVLLMDWMFICPCVERNLTRKYSGGHSQRSIIRFVLRVLLTYEVDILWTFCHRKPRAIKTRAHTEAGRAFARYEHVFVKACHTAGKTLQDQKDGKLNFPWLEGLRSPAVL